jgi:putative heme-binding domain-containing protein
MMKRVIVLAFASVMALVPRCSLFADEGQVFSLLIRTLRTTQDASVQASLLQGMLRGLEGRRDVVAPDSWGSLQEALLKSENALVRERTIALAQVFGDQAAVERALSTVMDPSQALLQRRDALGRLLNQQNREASSLLVKLMDDPEMRIDAIRGYAVVENPDAVNVLLTRFSSLDATQQRAAVETLASRTVYAESLLDAIQRGRVSREQIPSHVARSLSEMLGAPFTAVYGEVRVVAEDRTKLIAKYKALCNPDAIAAADAARGRAIYQRTCAACHTLYGEGGQVGPDLTGSNRANLDYILLNSVDPSYDVPDAYKTVSVLTVDGRSVNGVLAEEDATRIILKTAEQPRVVIAKRDIEQRRVSPNSMMPEGQLDQMKPQEVLDLIKYLRTTRQVELVQ